MTQLARWPPRIFVPLEGHQSWSPPNEVPSSILKPVSRSATVEQPQQPFGHRRKTHYRATEAIQKPATNLSRQYSHSVIGDKPLPPLFSHISWSHLRRSSAFCFSRKALKMSSLEGAVLPCHGVWGRCRRLGAVWGEGYMEPRAWKGGFFIKTVLTMGRGK